MRVTKIVKGQVNMAIDKLSGGAVTMKATDLLETQHREAEMLFAKVKKASGRDRRTLLTELADKLAAHMLIEQEIFYPTVRRSTDQGDTVLESFEEHGVARYELERLLETGASEDSFEPKLKVVKELIEHHVKEEEEDLFPKVNKQLGREKLEALGDEMKARFEKLVEQGHRKVMNSAAMAAGPSGRTTGKSASPSAKRGGTRRTANKKPGAATKKTAARGKKSASKRSSGR